MSTVHIGRPKKTAASPRAARTPKNSPGSDAPLVDVVLVSGTHVKRLALDIGRLIQSARQQVAQTANAALTALYWEIGTRIHQDVLKARRAEYGAHIVSAVGRELEAQYGRGFGEKSLWHMVRFAEVFPDVEIVSALRRQLAWVDDCDVKVAVTSTSMKIERLGAPASVAPPVRYLSLDMFTAEVSSKGGGDLPDDLQASRNLRSATTGLSA